MTLSQLKQKAEGHAQKKRVLTIADFLPQAEVEAQRRAAAAHEQRAKSSFDEVDAFCAEIIARFGYETYAKWNYGEISTDKMRRFLEAERSREYTALTQLEMVILSAVSATVHRFKGQPKPKGLGNAAKLIKENFKIIRGTK